MPPKKKPITNPSAKPPPKPKSKPKPKPTTSKPPPKRTTTKRPLSDPISDPTAPWNQNLKTQYARDKKCPRLSMATMHHTITEADITRLALELTGDSKESWGLPETKPITAAVARARPRGAAARTRPRGYGAVEERYMNMFQHLQSLQPAPKRIVANDPERSPILRVSYEVREGIYRYFLKMMEPVVLKPDFLTLEKNPFPKDAINILFACKLFYNEGITYLYKTNIFLAYLREYTPVYKPNLRWRMSSRYNIPTLLPKFSHSFLRDVILDCSSQSWGSDAFETAMAGLKSLVNADPKPKLKSLTLDFKVRKVGCTEGLDGKMGRLVTFSDWLWEEGELMECVKLLKPERFGVVVRLVEGKGVGMKVALKMDLGALSEGESVFSVDELRVKGELWTKEGERKARKRRERVERELGRWMERVEDIYEDVEKVIKEGKCIAGGRRKLTVEEKAAQAVECEQASSSGSGNGSQEVESAVSTQISGSGSGRHTETTAGTSFVVIDDDDENENSQDGNKKGGDEVEEELLTKLSEFLGSQT